VQIVNNSAIPAAVTDTTWLATGQPPALMLPYSTSGKSRSDLTIEFRANSGRTQVCLYDKTRNPPFQYTSGLPGYHSTSTGTAGAVSRTIVTEVTLNAASGALSLKGCLIGNGDAIVGGSAIVCGYNHRSDTPVGMGWKGRTGYCDAWELA